MLGSNFSLGIALMIILIFTSLSCSRKDENISGFKDIINFDKQDLSSELMGDYDPFEFLIHPEYFELREMDHIGDDALVLAYEGRDGQTYIFPHAELLVEVVNDQIDNIPLAINFCPLTLSGMMWDRRLEDDTLLLRASGYLYRNNLVVEDTLTRTIWSQMKGLGFEGALMHSSPETLNLVQMKWSAVKKYFRDAKVFQHDCEISCLGRNEKHDYADNHGNINSGVLKYGVLNRFNQSYAIFDHSDFSDSWEIFRNGQVLILGNKELEQIISFKTNIEFTVLEASYPVVLTDDQGSNWNIFGRAVDGPNKGQKLKSPFAFWALDHAWEELFE